MSKTWRFVFLGGLVAGTCDIVYTGVFWGISGGLAPLRVLQGVASGWLFNETSRAGGWGSAALGLVTHYAIAIAMAVAYYLVARRWAALWERPIPYGAAYGLLLYGLMSYVVVPLSAANPGSKDPLWVGLTIVVHMLLIGLPIALFARRAVLENLRSPLPAEAAGARVQ